MIITKPRREQSILKDEDDLLHQPDKTLKWRESYYFNWVDLENKISGFSTIGIVPNEKRREFVFILFIDNKREFYYQEPVLEKYVNDVDSMLQYKKLAYKIIEPLQTWQIIYKSRKFKMNLTFETRFPNHSFGTDSSGSWYEHFEASGIISGEILFKDGEEREINGYGQRDKSWGFRDWHQFDKWFAGHFQYKNWSAGFRKDYIGDRIDLSGYVTKKSESIPLTQMEIETINDNDKFKSPLKSIYSFTDAEGNSYRIEATRIEENSYVRFARDFLEGYTELFEQMVIMKDLETTEIGTGMSEQLRTVRF